MKHHNRPTSLNPLLIMTTLHFLLMYLLMYSMVDRLDNVLPNLNQLYMAGIMTSPMIILELLLMPHLPLKHRNPILLGSLIIFLLLFFALRTQTQITDKEFLKSMIPHHGGAILMCDNAPIADPQVKDLCDRIITSQEQEIAEMKQILNRLN